jgi:hypothetical protein
MLQSRLYQLEVTRRAQASAQHTQALSDISWGNQIRSYVLQVRKVTPKCSEQFFVNFNVCKCWLGIKKCSTFSALFLSTFGILVVWCIEGYSSLLLTHGFLGISKYCISCNRFGYCISCPDQTAGISWGMTSDTCGILPRQQITRLMIF